MLGVLNRIESQIKQPQKRFNQSFYVNVTGAKVDACKPDGWTALMEASKRGHTGFGKILLDRGAG